MGPKAVLFRLEIFSWRTWLHVVCNTLTLLFHQTFIIYILGTKPGIFFLQIQTELLELTISVAQPFLACPGTISVAQLFLACPETDFPNDITKASVAILATV